MKKLLILIVLLNWGFQTMQAQKPKNVEVKWTKEKKNKKTFYPKSIFAHDDTGYYMWIETGNYFYPKVYLQHYDSKFNLDKNVQLNLGKGSKKKNVLSILQLNDQLYMFTAHKNKKTKKHSLYLQTVNKKTLQPNKDVKKIASMNFAKRSKRNAGEYTITTSRDSTKVLIYYNLPYKKNEKEKFGFQVYDDNMNLIWKKNVTLPYIDKLFEIKDFLVDKNGIVYVLGKVYNQKHKDKRKGKVNYKYQILSYYNKGENLKKYDIKLKDKFVNNVILKVNKDNNLVCAGFYADKSSDAAQGVYFLTIDHQTKDIISENYKKFGAEFLTQFVSKAKKKRIKKKIAKGKKYVLENEKLQHIITKPDGGAVLIGEYQTVVPVTRTSTVNGITTTKIYYYHYFGTIIVVNIAPDGKILWAKKVPKLQISVDYVGDFTSYVKMITDDHIYLIYNDHPKNLTTSKNNKGKIYTLNGPKKSVITLATIDKNGKLTREIIPKPNKSKIYITPRVSKQLDDKTMVLFGQRGKKYRFARLIFKD